MSIKMLLPENINKTYFSIHPDNFKQEQFHQSQGKPHDNLGGQHYKQPLRSLPLESNTGHGHPYSDHGVGPGVTSIKTEQPDYNKYNYNNRFA